jgi:hypothetical protein
MIGPALFIDQVGVVLEDLGELLGCLGWELIKERGIFELVFPEELEVPRYDFFGDRSEVLGLTMLEVTFGFSGGVAEGKPIQGKDTA